VCAAEFYLSPLGGIDQMPPEELFAHLTFQLADSSKIIIFYSRRFFPLAGGHAEITFSLPTIV
jgi:hypothetical protein